MLARSEVGPDLAGSQVPGQSRQGSGHLKMPVMHQIGSALLLGASISLFAVGCGGSSGAGLASNLDSRLLAQLNSLPGGAAGFVMPDSTDFSSIPQDPRNPLTATKVQLGQMLFHETGLGKAPTNTAGTDTYSCASCHFAEAGFQANLPQGIGEGGSGFGTDGSGRQKDPAYTNAQLDLQPIRSPSAMNGAYQPVMLWNGQFGAGGPNTGTNASWTPGTPKEKNNLGYSGLETQAIAGLTVHRMVVNKGVLDSLGYTALFDQCFPEFSPSARYTSETAGLAIAAYERTLLANQSPWQSWLRGRTTALSESQKQGAMLFFGKAGCVDCHNGPALNSMDFHAMGMDDLFKQPGVFGANPSNAENRGRGGFTGNPADNYRFKVPQLYNLTDSRFYGHGASFDSVRAVVEYMNAGIAQNTTVPAGQISPLFAPKGLTPAEIDAIADFIENGLYDSGLARYKPASVLSGNCFPNNDTQSRIDILGHP